MARDGEEVGWMGYVVFSDEGSTDLDLGLMAIEDFIGHAEVGLIEHR